MKVLWRLIGYNWRYGWILIGILAATMATTLFSIATPWLLGSAIDEVLSSGLRSQLLLLAGAIFLVSVLRGIFSYFEQYLTESVSFRVEADLRNDLFRKLQHLSFGYHDRQWIGDLMSRSTTDVEEATRVTEEGLLTGLSFLFLFRGYSLGDANHELATRLNRPRFRSVFDLAKCFHDPARGGNMDTGAGRDWTSKHAYARESDRDAGSEGVWSPRP